MKDVEDAKFEKLLIKSGKYWAEFYAQLRKWVGEDKEDRLFDEYINKIIPHSDFMVKQQLLKNAAIKKHISSTHTWVNGKDRFSKKNGGNWWMFPLECSVCKIGASEWEEDGINDLSLKVILPDLPSKDMHGHYINRTCEEVQAARKTKKGKTKCRQCNTYGCISKGY